MKRRLALVAIALSVVGADRLSKQLIDDMSRETLPVDLLGTWARLVYGENHGGLFGLAQGSAPLLAALSVGVIVLLVFVHELGHFLAARRLGIRVITFSLGFGPKLLTTHRDGVEYAISAIPLGGYVKMAGESVEETRTGAPDEFLSKSKWERFQVLIMGPVMNIALAVIVMAGVLYQGAEVEHRRELACIEQGLERGHGRRQRIFAPAARIRAARRNSSSATVTPSTSRPTAS